jgi:hypothetical protein
MTAANYNTINSNLILKNPASTSLGGDTYKYENIMRGGKKNKKSAKKRKSTKKNKNSMKKRRCGNIFRNY